MKTKILKTIGLGYLAAIFCFACSPTDTSQKTGPESPKNVAVPGNGATSETAPADASPTASSSSPCANKYYPVKNGLKYSYENTVGGKTTQTMEYTDGAAEFTEVTALRDITVRHVWNCTDEGLIAANYGSAATVKDTQMEPKHLSGVTLPKEADIQIGKIWTTRYQAAGTSQIGAIDSTVELRNKIVSLDDEVKTPGGTFKAVKVDIEIVADMKIGGKKIAVPNIKSAAWFAPGIGMVKSTGGIGGISNTMEYAGEN